MCGVRQSEQQMKIDHGLDNEWGTLWIPNEVIISAQYKTGLAELKAISESFSDKRFPTFCPAACGCQGKSHLDLRHSSQARSFLQKHFNFPHAGHCYFRGSWTLPSNGHLKRHLPVSVFQEWRQTVNVKMSTVGQNAAKNNGRVFPSPTGDFHKSSERVAGWSMPRRKCASVSHPCRRSFFGWNRHPSGAGGDFTPGVCWHNFVKLGHPDPTILRGSFSMA